MNVSFRCRIGGPLSGASHRLGARARYRRPLTPLFVCCLDVGARARSLGAAAGVVRCAAFPLSPWRRSTSRLVPPLPRLPPASVFRPPRRPAAVVRPRVPGGRGLPRRLRSITARVKSRGPLCFPSSVYGKAWSPPGSSVQSPRPCSASMEPWTASSASSASMWTRHRPTRTPPQPSLTVSVTGRPPQRHAARPHRRPAMPGDRPFIAVHPSSGSSAGAFGVWVVSSFPGPADMPGTCMVPGRRAIAAGRGCPLMIRGEDRVLAGRRRTAEQEDTVRRDGWVKMEAGTADVPRLPRKTAAGGVGRVKAKTGV